VKNQGVDMYRKNKGNRQILSFFNRFYIGVVALSLFWGCAVKSDTVLIKDTSTAVEPDTIISAKTGETITFDELMNDLNSRQIVFIGERHTNTTHHAIQLKIIEAVFKNNHSMEVGMEMLDRSYQPVLDLWSGGLLEEEIFLRKVHWYANWRWDFAIVQEYFPLYKGKQNQNRCLEYPLSYSSPDSCRWN
jgi:uncharacterized iron-regulated protein